MTFPALRQLYYHRDYDGVVAAAMVQASSNALLELKPIQYQAQLAWTELRLGAATGIVDFLFHADALLWVDHHETTFSNDSARLAFRPDAFHVFAPHARSCPEVIAELGWFEGGQRWREYVHWASIIDGASYESATQANDFANAHILLSHVIGEIADPDSLAAIVRGIGTCSANDVLALPEVAPTRALVLRNDAKVRAELSSLLRLEGHVALLDQSHLSLPYRRYLAYELHPGARYGIGLYQSGESTIVSVGENPWNLAGPINLGQLCREFGGGGRKATAGVPVSSPAAARDLARILVKRLNDAVEAASAGSSKQ